ncbi:MAG: HEPN domain-containing protein [Candidatus Gastranaerophilaceae bacterium]|jgi:uncharacterized protein (UPF0332 family)
MIEEQLQLLNKSKDSLRGAFALFDSGLYAFAVSRAYYAMFYLAEAILLNEDFNYSKHSAVISAFGNNFIKTGKIPVQFHRYLIDGQSLRNIADYDVATTIEEDEAKTEIEHTQEFIDFAEAYLSEI